MAKKSQFLTLQNRGLLALPPEAGEREATEEIKQGLGRVFEDDESFLAALGE